MTRENVGGIPLGDSATSPLVVLCPITRADCTQGCVRECVNGTLRTPAPKPAKALPYVLDYEAVIRVRNMLRVASSDLAKWTPGRGYNEGACSTKLADAAMAVGDALGHLMAFFEDEGAAAVLAPRKETR